MVAGGLGGAACAAGFGGAALAASAAGFDGGTEASLPLGGGASELPGFCSSAMSVPLEDSYTYHLRGTCVKLCEAAQSFQKLSLQYVPWLLPQSGEQDTT